MSEDGNRRRFHSERKKVEANEGNPLHDGTSTETRQRILREVFSWLASCVQNTGRGVQAADRRPHFLHDLERLFGPGLRAHIQSQHAELIEVDQFLDVLELAADNLKRFGRPTHDIEVLNSLLADDLSRWRLRNVGSKHAVEFHVQHIDNPHLHRVIADRTFELTRLAEFSSAQHDYAEAWKHYSKGELAKAIFHAAKAVESASKTVVAKVKPDDEVEGKKLSQLVPKMSELDIIPSQFQTIAAQLETIFRNAGVLRNVDGIGHGSLEIENPDASIALLGLRLSGTLIAFLTARWLQMSASPAATNL